MSKGDELKFEGGAATKAEREYGNDGGKNRIHAHDCMAAAQESLGLPDIWSFEQGQSVPDVGSCLALSRRRTPPPAGHRYREARAVMQ
jgi:hypothetical protein